MTLVALDTDLCPDCGYRLMTREWHEPTLFRHGGHGATRRTTYMFCTCGYSLTTEVTEVRP